MITATSTLGASSRPLPPASRGPIARWRTAVRRFATGAAAAATPGGLALSLLVPAAGADLAAVAYTAPDDSGSVSHVAALADGTVLGAGDCGDGIAVARKAPGGSWRTTGAYWPADLRVEDVAADGVATFVVLSRQQGRGKLFFVGKQLHGSRSLSQLTEVGSTESAADRASVTAAVGKWAVAWTQTVYGAKPPSEEGTSSQVVVRGSLVGGGSRTVAGGAGMPGEASVALRSDGVHVLFTQQDGDARRRLRLAAVRSSGQLASIADYAPAAGAPASLPDAVSSGGTLVVGWSRNGIPSVAIGGSRRELPRRGEVTGLAVAASGGTAFVSTSERFQHQGGTTQRVYARDVTAAGLRRSTELSAAAGRRDPHVSVVLHSATAARGKATVATSAGISHQP